MLNQLTSSSWRISRYKISCFAKFVSFVERRIRHIQKAFRKSRWTPSVPVHIHTRSFVRCHFFSSCLDFTPHTLFPSIHPSKSTGSTILITILLLYQNQKFPSNQNRTGDQLISDPHWYTVWHTTVNRSTNWAMLGWEWNVENYNPNCANRESLNPLVNLPQQDRFKRRNNPCTVGTVNGLCAASRVARTHCLCVEKLGFVTGKCLFSVLWGCGSCIMDIWL